MVSAPAGSGKSTLVNDWVGGRSGGAGWVQIDEADDDPARFWAYFAASLSDVAPDLPDAVASAIGAGPDAIVAAIANEVATCDDEVVVVVDDYHLVTNSAVHRSLEQLVTHRPSNLVIVVSTRIDPPFRLARLRVSGQLTEIRAADLALDVDEAGWLLDAGAVGLSRDAVGRLHERTEGWAAGVVLAGLSMRAGDDVDEFVASFHGDDHLVADYLGEEFLDSLAADERARLLDVSVLDRMSAPLVDAVCGTDDGDSWLRTLASENQLVVALDRTGTWFRFHHLLRDVLRLELARRAPDRAVVLHAAAGRWHAQDGDLTEAIEHFIAAGETEAAADLVADNATALLNVGRIYTVTRYIERLGDIVDEHAGLAIVHGWVSFVTGRFGEAERALEVARRLDVEGTDAGLICSLTAMIHLAEGDVASGLAVVESSPPVSEPTHPMVLGGVRVMAGRFDDARPYLDTANEMAAALPDHFVAAVTPVFQAIGELEIGRNGAARTLASAAIAEGESHRIAEAAQLALAHSVMARTTDDPAAAVEAAARGVELARRAPERVALSYALTSAADVGFAHGSTDAAELLAEARAVVDRCIDPGIAGRYLARVESRHGRAERPRPAAPPAATATATVEELTERERAVLRYLPSRLTQREIAGELYVSLNTVKTHCRSIFRKLGVDGRSAAVQEARDRGVL